MNIRIEVASAAVRIKSGTSRQDKPYELRLQEGYLHNGHAYPDRFEFSVPQDEHKRWLDPYAPGFYTLAPSSLQVNREFGKLEINGYEFKLLRLPESEQGQYAANKVKAA